MADDRTVDATGEPTSYEHPDAKAVQRARAAARRDAELPPGAIGRWARTGTWPAATVRLGQLLLCLLVVVVLARASTDDWLQPGTLLLAFLLNLALQQLFVLVNRRR